MTDRIDESEETLSLSDLPLYSDQSADWDQDFSVAFNSISSSQDNYFEFFTQQFHPSAAAAFPPENIIFCGKLIPYKQQPTCELEIKNQINDDKQRRCRLFRLKFSSSRSSRSKNGERSTTTLMPQSPTKMYNMKKRGKGLGRIMSIFTSASSSSGRAKWYFLLFGISRFSPVIEMRDIKSRQNRRHCPSPPQMFGFENNDGKVISGRRWRMWGLIRALSCG